MIRIRQNAPNQIELEFVYGCNMGCSFCGLMGVKNGFTDHRMIEESTLIEIVDKIRNSGWKSKIVISGHGEPMLHPEAVSLVNIIRKGLPDTHVAMITNGTNLTKQTILDLFANGLNHLAIDEYTKSNRVEQIREFIYSIEIPISDYKTSKNSNARNSLIGKSGNSITILEPIDSSNDKTRKLVNRCGSAFPKNDSRKNSRCAKPFREMFFDYEGNLLLCCHDFRREMITGNIYQYKSIEELWNNSIIEMYRKLLYKGCRCIFPCEGCDSLSYRVGLLPDKLGKQEMPDWTEGDNRILSSLVKRTEDTRLRMWEEADEHSN